MTINIITTYNKVFLTEINLDDAKDSYMQETVTSFNGQLKH